MAVPAPSLPRGRHAAVVRTLLAQVAMVVAAALCYFGVRGLTQGGEAIAHRNADRLVEVERALRIDLETWLQSLVIGRHALVMLANWVYIYGHWPVVIGTLVWMFLRVPDRYYTLRNALFASGAIGLIIFALIPVAPPRFGVLPLLDTVTERSSSYRALQPPGLINRYAALPSLHFGWNLILGIAIWQAARNRAARAFAVVMPVAMAFAVVATGNHYAVDVLSGAAVALAGLGVALVLPRVRRTPGWAEPRR